MYQPFIKPHSSSGFLFNHYGVINVES